MVSRFDIFKEKIVYDYFLKKIELENTKENVEEIILEDVLDTVILNQDTNYNLVCRLCTKAGDVNCLFLQLYDSQNKRLPIGEKLATIIGSDKVKQDLLPQQICLQCSENVKLCYDNCVQFCKSFKLLNKTMESFKDDIITSSQRQGSELLALTIDSNDYDVCGRETKRFERNRTPRKRKCSRILKSRIKSDSQCYLCLKTLKTNLNLKEHLRDRHSCQIEYSCLFCNGIFDTLDNLKIHMNSSVKCSIKGRKGDKLNDLIIENELAENEAILEDDIICQEITFEEFSNNNVTNILHESDGFTLAQPTEDNRKDVESNFEETIHVQMKNGTMDSHEQSDHDYSFNEGSDVVGKENESDKKRRHKIIKTEVINIIKTNTKLLKSCVHCKQIFKPNKDITSIEQHVLCHLYMMPDKVNDLQEFDLNKHLTYSNSYVCTFCDTPKQNKTRLKEHLYTCKPFLSKHNLINLIPKKKIPKKDESANSIQRVANDIKENTKRWSCSYCEDQFDEKNVYKIHINTMHTNVIPTCSFCEKTFMNKKVLRTHIQNLHLNANISVSENEKTVLCEFCPRIFANNRLYKQHRDFVHFKKHKNSLRSKGNKFVIQNVTRNTNSITKKNRLDSMKTMEHLLCDICNKNIMTRGLLGLEFHKIKHMVPNGKVKCCNKYLHTLSMYLSHMRAHQGRWICQECSNNTIDFNSFVSYVDHIRDAHTTFDMICHPCNLQFFERGQYQEHLNLCQNRSSVNVSGGHNSEESLLYCCGLKFKSANRLNTHVKKHRSIQCKKCGTLLSSMAELQSHNNQYHRTSSHVCAYCNKTLVNGDSLKYHMLKHTTGKQIECPCGLKFYTVNDLKKHHKRRKVLPCIGQMLNSESGIFEEDTEDDWDDVIHSNDVIVDEVIVDPEANLSLETLKTMSLTLYKT